MGDELQFPDIGRFALYHQTIQYDEVHVGLYDSDTRRTVVVNLPNPHGLIPRDDDPEYYIPLKKAAEALTRHIEDLPIQVVAIKIDDAGEMLSVSTDPAEDVNRVTDGFLLKDYQLPPGIAAKTVLRSELTEMRRLDREVDLVSYPDRLFPTTTTGEEAENHYVIKYLTMRPLLLWNEVQMLARLPPNPHLAALDRLVLDEATESRVIGFTMRYVPNPTLNKSKPRFKLEWLRQLMRVVDTLNLEHGIIHQDIADRNLIIDPATDSIVLIDFNVATRVGAATKRLRAGDEVVCPGSDDVKGVMAFLYKLITKDTAFDHYALVSVNEKDMENPAKWVKHPEVELDDDVAHFYFELMAWVRSRRASEQMTTHTEARQHLLWPKAPQEDADFYVIGARYTEGLPYLDWRRPPSSKVDPTRRLLANGRYADEHEAEQRKATVPSTSPATATKPSSANRQRRLAGKSNGRPNARAAAPGSTGKAPRDGLRRKLPAR